MPLLQGKSDNSRSKNIAELINSGYPPKQAAAIAYREQRKASKDSESAREYDLNNFMEIKGNSISKVGVFPYSGAQIGHPDLDPDKIYNVYRPEEALNDPETIQSFKLIPFTDEHAMLGTDAGMMAAEEKGVHGVIGEDVFFESPYLKANIKVFSEKLKNLINEGKKELSIGYRCLYEYSPGVYNGDRYDFIQTEIRGNHLALVEEGRSGHDVSVMDKYKFTYDSLTFLNAEIQMEEETMSLEKCFERIKELEYKLASMMNSEMDEEPEEEAKKELTEKAAEEGDAKDTDVEPADFVARADITDSDESPTEEEAKNKEKNLMKRKQGEDEDSTREDGDTERKGGAMDAKLKKSIMLEISQRDMLAKKLSKHIGTFDHSEKTLQEVAQYGVKRLKLSAKPGHEESVLSGYLAGARPSSVVNSAQDSRPQATGIAGYLKGVS